jgi:hypothetical protein
LLPVTESRAFNPLRVVLAAACGTDFTTMRPAALELLPGLLERLVISAVRSCSPASSAVGEHDMASSCLTLDTRILQRTVLKKNRSPSGKTAIENHTSHLLAGGKPDRERVGIVVDELRAPGQLSIAASTPLRFANSGVNS